MQPMIRRVPQVRAAGVAPGRDAHRGPLEGRQDFPGRLALGPPRTTRLSAASWQIARAISGEVCDYCGGPRDPVALGRESRCPVRGPPSDERHAVRTTLAPSAGCDARAVRHRNVVRTGAGSSLEDSMPEELKGLDGGPLRSSRQPGLTEARWIGGTWCVQRSSRSCREQFVSVWAAVMPRTRSGRCSGCERWPKS